MMNFDKILIEELGQFGKYQKITIAYLSLIVIFFAFASNEYDYTTAEIPHRCRIPACDGMSSDVPYPEFRPDWLLNAISGENMTSFDKCTRFAHQSKPSSNETCPAEWFNRTRVVDCDEYVYENTNTAVYDFNLACDDKRRTILDTYTSLVTLHMLIQAGASSDKKGRRGVLISSLFKAAILGFSRSFITAYIWFLITRIIQMGFGCSAFVLSYVLGVELVGPNKRVLVGAILSTMIPIGEILLAFVAWAVTSWRAILLIIFTPQLLVITYFWVIHESVRWLMIKEEYTESEAILRKIATVNKKQLSNITINNLQSLSEATTKNDKKNLLTTLRLIWKTPGITPRIFMNLLWYVTYSAIGYATEKKGINLTSHSHLNHIYVSVFAILGIWTAALLLDRIGRKRVLISGYLLCAACQFAFAFIPEDSTIWLTMIYLLSKYFLALVTTSINLYSIELFPTECRGFLFAYFCMHTILGQKIEPLISALGPMSWIGLPSVMFSCMAIISAVLVIFAPETRGTKLPDTVEEAGQLGKEKKADITMSTLLY